MIKEKINKRNNNFVRRIFFLHCALCIVNCTLLSCLSVVEKAGRGIDGTASNEKKTAVYRDDIRKKNSFNIEVIDARNKAGEKFLIISIADYPMIRFRGTAPDEDGIFYLASLEYLSGSSSGWNEFNMSLLGEGVFLPDNSASMAFEINEEIEKIEIISGRIKRYDTMITGSDAVTRLRNRRERIEVLAEWMKTLNPDAQLQNIKEFEKYWKPVLFPEITAKRKRPADWLQENDVFEKAEDIKWNTGYTERVFPEELRPIRNSGTLLRDWEEAIAWIYIEYEWENIVSLISKDIILVCK